MLPRCDILCAKTCKTKNRSGLLGLFLDRIRSKQCFTDFRKCGSVSAVSLTTDDQNFGHVGYRGAVDESWLQTPKAEIHSDSKVSRAAQKISSERHGVCPA